MQARPSLEQGNVEEILDANLLLEPDCNLEMMLKMGQLGLRCVAKVPKQRPAMTHVWQELESSLYSTDNSIYKQPSKGPGRSIRTSRQSMDHDYSQSFDTFDGKNQTAVQVAQANTTTQSFPFFGSVHVIDDPLTVGPEPNSTIIGRAQGIYASVGMKEFDLLMTLTYVFTSGKFNGSTLSILGWNPTSHTYREMPIVGGSGIFRLAQGIATAKTYQFNPSVGFDIIDFHVIVRHYE